LHAIRLRTGGQFDYWFVVERGFLIEQRFFFHRGNHVVIRRDFVGYNFIRNLAVRKRRGFG
jgi:hypothetical protein